MSEKVNGQATERTIFKDKYGVPLWHRFTLTIEEASAYTGVGVGTLSKLISREKCPFVLQVGTKRLIKRKTFEEYLERQYSI